MTKSQISVEIEECKKKHLRAIANNAEDAEIKKIEDEIETLKKEWEKGEPEEAYEDPNSFYTGHEFLQLQDEVRALKLADFEKDFFYFTTLFEKFFNLVRKKGSFEFSDGFDWVKVGSVLGRVEVRYSKEKVWNCPLPDDFRDFIRNINLVMVKKIKYTDTSMETGQKYTVFLNIEPVNVILDVFRLFNKEILKGKEF